MEENEIKRYLDNAMSMANTPVVGARGLTSSQRGLAGNIANIAADYGLGQQNIAKGIEEGKLNRDVIMRGQDLGLLGDKLKLGIGDKIIPGSRGLLTTTTPSTTKSSIWDDTSWNDFSTKFKSIFG